MESLSVGQVALRGAADVMIKCVRSGPNSISLKCTKMKDGEHFPSVNGCVGTL